MASRTQAAPTESTTAPTTAVAVATPGQALAVPPGLPIDQEDWAALSEAERQEAMVLYAAETQTTLADLTPEFPKIVTPTGGGQAWTLPNGDLVKEFAGVVVAHFKARAYWPPEAPIANNPPACSSVDGRYPVGGQGPTGATQCAACPMNTWGTGKEGRGKACKERLNVFVLLQDTEIPHLLSIPPTGIKAFSRYAVALVNQKPVRPLSSLVTVFGLEKKQGAAGPAYSVVAPRPSAESLSYAEVRAVIAMREKFKEAMSRRGITEAEVAVEDPEDGTGSDADAAAKGSREDAGF